MVKVEPPGGDQQARRLPPFLPGMPALQKSAMFYYLNAGKSLVTADATTPTGGQLVARLALNSTACTRAR